MNKENLKRTIRQYYLGRTSPIEEEFLFEEISKNPVFLRFFRAYEKKFAERDLNTDASNEVWARFYKKYLDERRIVKRRILKTYVRYAAVACITLLVTFGVWLVSERERGADNSVEWYETYVPKGEKTTLILPDGTKVWLNAETTLKYPATPLKDKRIMQLSGEAFFEVTKNKKLPFIVQTADYEVVVTGTSFNIMAYDDFKRTETALLSGVVEIRNIKGRQPGETVNIVPGEKVVFNKKEETIKILNTDARKEAAWKDNLFIFTDIRFEELCQRLERWYDVDITIADQELKEIRYTGNFRNEETIWQVLDVIKVTTPIEYTLKNRKLTIYHKKQLPMN